MIKDHHNKYINLRRKYTRFDFKDFNIISKPGLLDITFCFDLSGKHEFTPRLCFDFPDRISPVKALPSSVLERAAFSLGMTEMISYWKAACPPDVYVRPFKLSDEEIAWWKKLYFNGLGEFFYVNRIGNNSHDFMQIHTGGDVPPPSTMIPTTGVAIIPVGGGKDSAVTLELLKDMEPVPVPLMINPGPAGRSIIETAGFKEENTIRITREIDHRLLELNAAGFLNGHTPFSAVVAFTSFLAALATGAGYIALSNESSANEPTDPVTGVNHQYSKTIQFESDFRYYAGKFISSSVEYFSFLRPLNELQIAALFAGFRKYHPVFRSCNKGSKQNVWCGSCSKCLFTWIALSPFMSDEELRSIWGKDLFSDRELIPVLDELAGLTPVKPFECVGTVEDVCRALSVNINSRDQTFDMPPLLEYFRASDKYQPGLNLSGLNLKTALDSNHFLPSAFEEILKKRIA